MSFADYAYSRPDMKGIDSRMRELTEAFKRADSAEMQADSLLRARCKRGQPTP